MAAAAALLGDPPSEHSSFDGEEEGEDQEDAIQTSMFERYLTECDAAEVDAETDALFARGLMRVQQYLAGGRDNTLCLICLGHIKPTEAVWSCDASCFAMFHLTCIQEWARNQLATAAYKASRAEDAAPAAPAHGWGCPKCRAAYDAAQLPSCYTCFCGKLQEPEWDPWLAAHSCGELCGKPLPGGCVHRCVVMCHPGPCPPCPLLVDASCHCGKAVLKQRCGKNEFSCRGVCGKQLPCGHRCPETCHAKACPPCQEVGTHACACGAETASLPCWQSRWHCAKPCARLLACGRHRCEEVCHAGPCGGCPEEGERHCPCGKAVYQGLPCDEKAAPCGGTCGKLLPCGVHRCPDRCHHGPCTKTCRELVLKSCRCGRTQKQVLCSADVRCESKCSAMRSCGRHACRRRCCDGNCPPCEEVCQRKLRCGNHRDPATCHAGPCRPCPLSQLVTCACGHTSYTLPCGAETAAVPPRCRQRCPVVPVCRHAAAAKPHHCHFGACPPCRAPCGASFACGHSCPASSCHDARPPAVAGFQRPRPPKAGAAAAGVAAAAGGAKQQAAANGSASGQQPLPPARAAAAAAAELAASGGGITACPACTAPVQVSCLGGHAARALPCCTAAPFSCEAACGRPLACGNHRCSRACHAATTAGASSSSAAAAAAAAAGEPCEVCTRPCARPRSCSHPCPSRCHPGDCAPCAAEVAVDCRCGKTSLAFACSELQRLQQRRDRRPAGSDPLCCDKPCLRALPRCPHECQAPCHAPPCPGAEACAQEVSVRCSCRRLKEKWPCQRVQAALAAAGQPGYDGSAALKLLPCDAECAAAQRAREKQPQQPQPQQAAGAGSASGAPPNRAAAAAAAAAPAEQAAPAAKGAKRLSRAERDALAAAREAERAAAERRERLRWLAWAALAALAVLGVGAALALGLETLLAWVDAALQARYGSDEL